MRDRISGDLRKMNGYEILAKDYDDLNPKEEIFKQKPFPKTLIKK
jgi:hypothetical protein